MPPAQRKRTRQKSGTMSTIDELIAPFRPVSLDQMDQVKLMNRMDTKFLFSANRLPCIMEKLYDSYDALEIGEVRLQRYETLYFDTQGHQLYLTHHNQRLNRYKVRSRRYLDSGITYFEIKFKNNKGRTTKERNKHKGVREEISGKQQDLLLSCTGLTPDKLIPVLWVNFSRLTLVNREMTERVTLDTGLSFRNQNGECSFPWVAIAEVKQDRSAHSRIADILHDIHSPGTNISKYCLGIASLNPQIKKNNFKWKLHCITKLQNDIC